MKGYNFTGPDGLEVHVAVSGPDPDGDFMATSTAEGFDGTAHADQPELAALALLQRGLTDITLGRMDTDLKETKLSDLPAPARGPGLPSDMSALFPFTYHSSLLVLVDWDQFHTSLLRRSGDGTMIEFPPHRASVSYSEKPHRHVSSLRLTIEEPYVGVDGS